MKSVNIKTETKFKLSVVIVTYAFIPTHLPPLSNTQILDFTGKFAVKWQRAEKQSHGFVNCSEEREEITRQTLLIDCLLT